MSAGRRKVVAVAAAVALGFLNHTGVGRADTTPQTLPFSQNWTNVGLITTSNDWSGVPGIIGYRGDDLTTATGADPQTILADGSGTPVNVLANQTNPNTNSTGAVAEFDTLANPVVALQGSGTADAPHIVLSVDTTGVSSVQVSYNLRDIDGSTDNAVQAVALQYRVGSTGSYTNLPAGFVADATTGPSTATLVTPVSVTLPAAASNQPLVQIRIITTNAVGNDEWVGVDDINVTAASTGPSGSGAASPNIVHAGDTTLLTVATTPGSNPSSPVTSVIANLSAIGQTNAQLFFDDGTNGDVTSGDGTYSFLATVDVATTAGVKSLPATITDALSRTGSATISLTVQSDATNPSGAGAATPSTVPPGSGTLLTVSVTPGANPPSTGLTVIGDLTAIGQTNAQLFFDDGTNGDVTAGDNVFSVAATVDGATTLGSKTLPVTITDAQSRSGSASISLIVGDVVPPVVISQVFGGGGEPGAPFHNDFVELFNRGASPADLGTWSLQYATATGTTWEVIPLSGILQPGRYYLVQLATAGGGGAALPAPNATATTNVDFAAGKLALLSTTTTQTGACPASGVVDLVGYGAADCFEGAGPAPTGTAATADVRLLKGCSDGNNNVADFTRDAPTPRNGSTAALDCSQQQPPTVTLRAIDAVQGNGNASPFANQTVRVRGIVTGRTSNTFFLQTPDGAADNDGDPATSEGIAIFVNAAPTVNSGDFVEVTGTVQEFVPNADLASPPKTEILPAGGGISVFSSGNPLPAAVAITAGDTPPTGSIEQLEKLEGMRVRVDSLTVIGPTGGNVNEPSATSTTTGIFYGVVTGVARPFREPGIEVPDALPPGAPASIPRFDANPERLRVDSDLQTGAVALDVSAGQVVTNLVGPLDYSFRTYTIAPDPGAPPTVTGTVAPTPVPVPGAAQFTVASFNMERFFDTVNDPGISEPVLTPTAFNNRLNKASLLIRNVLRTPDVLAVQEMENLTTLQALATKINTDAGAGGPAYQAYLMEGNDIGGIDVGYLVKSTRVTVVDVDQVGKDATYIDPSTGQPALLNDRPSLVMRIRVPRATGPDYALTLIDNHLRSLSGVDDPADGGRVRAKRRAQAEFLANVIQARQVADPNERILSVGDYNAFGFNDGYVDSIGTIRGQPTPADEVTLASPDLVDPDLVSLETLVAPDQRYSFIFDGNAQELDHALVTQNLLAGIGGVARARVDGDFAEILRNDPNRPERLSDHDPLEVYINLPAVTQTSLMSSANPSTFGQPVTFTAAVTVGATPVTQGSVTFKDGNTVLGTVNLDASGHAAFTTSTLSGGDHPISATFSGTSTLDGSSASLTQTVNSAATTTALAGSPNPSGQGQAVTFTATVTRGATPVTAGTVTFREGTVVLGGPVTVNASGQASFSTSTLSVGSHTVRADYSGTPDNAASSGSTTQSVMPGLVVSDVSVVEGNAPNTVAALFTLTLSSAAGQPVMVGYATQDGTATAGSDYEARSGQILFPIGVTQRRVAVVIVSDTVVEPDEAFTLRLTGATNAVIVDGSGAGLIVNDDQTPVPTLAISDVTVREKESGSTATFVVTLSFNPGQAVTVSYETADGTATSPDDYLPRSGTLTFAPGTLTQTIEVPVLNDNLPEPREVYYVVLTSPANATLSDGLGIGTIVNISPFPHREGGASSER